MRKFVNHKNHYFTDKVWIAHLSDCIKITVACGKKGCIASKEITIPRQWSKEFKVKE